jgi:TPR repeat protein
MANSSKSAQFLMESRFADQVATDDGATMYDLGVAYSTGSAGKRLDLIEAHKWFNLAAVAGFLPAQIARAEVASDMTAREIAEAQRQARAFLHGNMVQMRAA